MVYPKGGNTDKSTGVLNYGVGDATREEAEMLGKAWVGEGAKKTSLGWESADGLRKYRSPKNKPNSDKATTGTQANFETLEYDIRNVKTKSVRNGHLNITD